jgi:hypothetical protein
MRSLSSDVDPPVAPRESGPLRRGGRDTVDGFQGVAGDAERPAALPVRRSPVVFHSRYQRTQGKEERERGTNERRRSTKEKPQRPNVDISKLAERIYAESHASASGLQELGFSGQSFKSPCDVSFLDCMGQTTESVRALASFCGINSGLEKENYCRAIQSPTRATAKALYTAVDTLAFELGWIRAELEAKIDWDTGDKPEKDMVDFFNSGQIAKATNLKQVELLRAKLGHLVNAAILHKLRKKKAPPQSDSRSLDLDASPPPPRGRNEKKKEKKEKKEDKEETGKLRCGAADAPAHIRSWLAQKSKGWGDKEVLCSAASEGQRATFHVGDKLPDDRVVRLTGGGFIAIAKTKDDDESDDAAETHSSLATKLGSAASEALRYVSTVLSTLLYYAKYLFSILSRLLVRVGGAMYSNASLTSAIVLGATVTLLTAYYVPDTLLSWGEPALNWGSQCIEAMKVALTSAAPVVAEVGGQNFVLGARGVDKALGAFGGVSERLLAVHAVNASGPDALPLITAAVAPFVNTSSIPATESLIKLGFGFDNMARGVLAAGSASALVATGTIVGGAFSPISAPVAVSTFLASAGGAAHIVSQALLAVRGLTAIAPGASTAIFAALGAGMRI